MKIEIKKFKTNEITETYDFPVDKFYARFYDSCNREVYFGGKVGEKNIVWFKFFDNTVFIEKFKKMPGGVDNLKLFIEKALKNYKFLNKISEEKFNNKIDDFFDNDV